MSQKNVFDKVGILVSGNFKSDIVYKTRLPNGITVLRVITLFSEDSRRLFTRLKKIMNVNISTTTPIVYYPKTIQQIYFFYKLFRYENRVSHVEDTKKRVKKALNTLQDAYFKLVDIFPEDVALVKINDKLRVKFQKKYRSVNIHTVNLSDILTDAGIFSIEFEKFDKKTTYELPNGHKIDDIIKDF